MELKRGTLIWIENRSHESIIPKVEQNVQQRSIILTDELRTYACLSRKGYEHRTVNHSREFLADDGTHTNHIEAYFSRVKTFLRKRNVGPTQSLPGYLDEFLWMERHRNNIWQSFLDAVRRKYRC